MKKYYYGAWQNFYHLGWPVRFFIELLLVWSLVLILIRIIKWIFWKNTAVKKMMVSGCVWVAKELIYLVGRNSEWAVNTEGKIIDWGESVIKGEVRKRKSIVKKLAILATIVIYIGAVFADLPFTNRLQGSYLEIPFAMKSFFQSYESAMSYGYDMYPPLFHIVKKEKSKEKENETEKMDRTEKVKNLKEKEEPVYLYINEIGRNGSNIRTEPSLNSKVIIAVQDDVEMIYQNEFVRDDERFWLKVYLPNMQIEGWISANLVEAEQLEEILPMQEN